MQRHKNVECTGAEQLNSDLIEEVKFTRTYHDYKDELSDMLSKLKDKWDGPLGRINVVKH